MAAALLVLLALAGWEALVRAEVVDALTRREMQEWLAGALAQEPRTVLLVTHDVDEAVLLADRVVVLSPRPGRVVAELDVAAARPRRSADPELVALRERALEALRA